MPPIDLPRGNAAKAVTPRPASAYRNPPPRSAPTPPTFADMPHGRGVISTPRPAPPRPASAYRNPPPAPPAANLRTGNNPRGTSIVASHIAAKSAAPGAPQRLSASGRLARVIAAVTRVAANNPWEPVDQPNPFMTGPIRQMMVRGQYAQDFQNLKTSGLLPRGAQMPPLSFVDRGAGKQGELSYEIGSGGRGHVYLTPLAVQAATDPHLTSIRGYGLTVPIHELAHALQRGAVQRDVVTREGGAQAFADAAVPAVVGPVPTWDTNYSGYVRQVRRKGPDWYMREQFGGS